MKTREELIQHCKDQIRDYVEDMEHDLYKRNTQDASEDKGRIEAYRDILRQLGVPVAKSSL
jgi:hypothetical protein